jgi:hypothetical protein
MDGVVLLPLPNQVIYVHVNRMVITVYRNFSACASKTPMPNTTTRSSAVSGCYVEYAIRNNAFDTMLDLEAIKATIIKGGAFPWLGPSKEVLMRTITYS